MRLLWLLLPALLAAKRYPVEGIVVEVDPRAATVTVSHGAIPGYMPAMVMPFRAASAAALGKLHPGSRVSFDLVTRKAGSRAENIRIRSEEPADGVTLPVPANRVAVGAEMPDFALIDERGERLSLHSLRGKVVVADFIYTRCPVPEFCPRLSANFAALQRRFRGVLGRELVLLSITIDPAWDTPEQLARYAKLWRADPAGWKFLGGSPSEVGAVADRFGLVYWPEEGLITHTAVTAIIGRDGTLAASVDGPSYGLGQLSNLIEHQLERK